MSLSPEDISKIAHLARLAINDADRDKYAADLNNILDLVAQMNALDTEGVTPMSHPFNAVQRLREDTVVEADQHKLFQQIAPATEAGLYLVPKVIEGANADESKS